VGACHGYPTTDAYARFKAGTTVIVMETVSQTVDAGLYNV